jgi:hypothetical protein
MIEIIAINIFIFIFINHIYKSFIAMNEIIIINMFNKYIYEIIFINHSLQSLLAINIFINHLAMLEIIVTNIFNKYIYKYFIAMNANILCFRIITSMIQRRNISLKSLAVIDCGYSLAN